MMSDAHSIQNIHRLTELRRSRLEHLRQEFEQLRVLSECEQAKVANALGAYETQSEAMAKEEQSAKLNVADMLASRRYLTQLQSQLVAAEKQLAIVLQQSERARRDLEAMLAEVRSLECLGERREETLRGELRRREYGVADDLALLQRFSRGERSHG